MAFIKPHRLKYVHSYLPKTDNFKILDIGAGSHSPTITKKYYPNCEYSGVDITSNYNNSEDDLKAMDHFYEMDLTKLEFASIPDNYFDVMIMSHVVEHLYNGDLVLKALISKLKPGGIFYIEFPAERSVSLPSKKETLNFFDDDTHVRIYSLKEICNLFLLQNCIIVKAGTVKSWFNIFLMPIKIIWQTITKGYVKGGVFWDWYGFADFVLIRRKQ